jgi:hemolysin III
MELRDPVSSASHILTAIWAVYATLILWKITCGGTSHRIAVAVYGVSMVLLYLASGTFHGVPYTRVDHPDEFRFFQRLDHTGIYLLIAGTNTPALVILVGGTLGRRYLALMWGIAAVGIGCLWLLPKPPHALNVAMYLGMGWLGVLPAVHYYRAVGWRAMNWVWLGAACYTLGAVCELTKWPTISDWPVRVAHHEVMHFCDIGGTLAFFVFIVRHVIPYRKPATDEAPDTEPEPDLAAAA